MSPWNGLDAKDRLLAALLAAHQLRPVSTCPVLALARALLARAERRRLGPELYHLVQLSAGLAALCLVLASLSVPVSASVSPQILFELILQNVSRDLKVIFLIPQAASGSFNIFCFLLRNEHGHRHANQLMYQDYKKIATYYGDGKTFHAIEGQFRKIRVIAEVLRAAVDEGTSTTTAAGSDDLDTKSITGPSPGKARKDMTKTTIGGRVTKSGTLTGRAALGRKAAKKDRDTGKVKEEDDEEGRPGPNTVEVDGSMDDANDDLNGEWKQED